MVKAAHKRSQNYCSQSGFSLISISLLIIVVGLLTAAGIFLGKQYSYSEKQDLSTGNIATIQQALEDYKALNRKLPCPAPLDAGVDTATFGKAMTTCSVSTSGMKVVNGRSAFKVSYGAVPVRTLGLSDKSMLDGWNHRLIYAVTYYYTNGAPNFDADQGAITVVDSKDVNMTPNSPDRVIYAVISPGADDRGAYNVSGTVMDACPTATTVLARENCDMADATFRSTVVKQWDTGTTTLTSTMKYGASDKAYAWRANDWAKCKCGSDDNPQQIRVGATGSDDGVKCIDVGAGTTVADSFCMGQTKPAATQSCTAYCWKVTQPVLDCDCSNEGASASGSVECDRKYNSEILALADTDCTSFDSSKSKPTVPSKSCPASIPACHPSYGGGGGGGGGGNSGGGSTYYVNNGVTFTGTTDSHGNTTYQSGWNPTSSSAYGPSYSDYGSITSGGGGGGGGGSSSSGSSGGGGGSSVICTHFYRKRRMPGDLWRADLEFATYHLPETMVRGYHTWGIKSVYLMRKYPWTENFFAFIAINRAEEVGYQLGLRDKPNYTGKIMRAILEPLCFVIGIFAPKQNWQKVHGDFNPGQT